MKNSDPEGIEADKYAVNLDEAVAWAYEKPRGWVEAEYDPPFIERVQKFDRLSLEAERRKREKRKREWLQKEREKNQYQ